MTAVEAFFDWPTQRRVEQYERVADARGLSPSAIEKDFWVCWVLRELFGSDAGAHVTFKGGTSLSKCWGLIERFSEDIDLVVDRGVLGFEGDAAPEAGGSRREQERRVEAVQEACRRHVHEDLLPALSTAVSERLGRALPGSSVDLDPDAEDGQTILFNYESLFSGTGYLRPVVKIELGARSDTEPSEAPTIQPYVVQGLEDELGSCSFAVRAVAPVRTFWEKVALLHEEGYRSQGPRPRLARHYYDLWCLDRKGIAERALADSKLFARIIEHRRLFFRHGAEAQRRLAPGSVRLVPQPDRLGDWEADFGKMLDTMFFGDPPDFGAIMTAIGELERRINQLPARS